MYIYVYGGAGVHGGQRGGGRAGAGPLLAPQRHGITCV